MKLDILAIGAHPDDVELGCAGTLAKEVANGAKVGILDLTLGEMDTRGTPEIRKAEGLKAAEVVGASVRETLSLRDGFINSDEASQKEVIKMIRKYRPEIVICNAPHDRHPDHSRSSELVVQASFLSGLRKLETDINGEIQDAWRPKNVYHYIQYYGLEPDFIVDISGFMETKMNSIKAHASQFFDPNSDEPETVISSKNFFDSVDARAREYGRQIYVEHGEGFIAEGMPGVNSLQAFL